MKLQHCVLVLTTVTIHISDGKRLILDLIDKLRSSQTKSISPSWEGIRRFDLIGTGKLPLQSHKLETEYGGELLEGKQGNSDGSNRRVFSEGEGDRVMKVPGQFSRNRGGQINRASLQRFPPDTGINYRYNQDPETKIRENYDRFGFTWGDNAQRRNRRSASPSPYNRIKIKIPNPFYFSNPKRRRVRIKKIVPAQTPPRSHTIDRNGPQGFWDSPSFERNYFDSDLGNYENTEDILQHLDLLDTDLDRREPLESEDIYQTQEFTEEERELLGSGNFIIESGGTFYDEEDGGYSDSQYFPVGQYSGNHVDNFRDFADIKQDRLYGYRGNRGHRRKYHY